MNLRDALMALGLLLLIGALTTLLRGGEGVVASWLAINGLALTIGIVYERWRYKANQVQPPSTQARATGERFVDPETGHVVEVYYDPASGDRSYVDGRTR